MFLKEQGGKSGLHANKVPDNVRRGSSGKSEKDFRESATERIPLAGHQKPASKGEMGR